MYNSYKIMEHLSKEMDKKADAGIRSVNDLDTVVKLAQAMKDLAKADYYCAVTEAMEEEGYSHNDYSERRKRDSRGRYSRDGGYGRGESYERGNSYNHGGAYDRYMEAKHSYRASRSPEHKKEMSGHLSDYSEELKDIAQSLINNADTREEREEIKKMLREIGNMA